MSKYKINIDKPAPSKEEINKFKNFENVVSDYKKLHSPWDLLKDLYKDKKLIRIFIVLLAILFAVVFGTQESDENNGINEQVKDSQKEILKDTQLVE
jgi:hypothetical protein